MAHVLTGARFYTRRATPASRWRRHAREVICAVLAAHPDADVSTVVAAVDAAYPFGARAHHPYKAWLTERKLLIGDLGDAAPSADEWAAIEVAADLVEEGRLDEAQKLLDDQAPNRLARPCRTCGRPKGRPCYEPGAVSMDLGNGHTMPGGPDRIIPHAARCQP